MEKQDFTTSFTVDQPPQEVFKAVNNVRGWRSGGVDGDLRNLITTCKDQPDAFE